MASVAIGRLSNRGCRPSLAEIDAVVAARLGPTRVSGNSQPACFNRQIAMYLAARLGGWSTTAIGEFYSGRDHSTVCYAIQRIEALLESDPEVETLITELKHVVGQLSPSPHETFRISSISVQAGASSKLSLADINAIADLIAARVCERLRSP